MPRADLYTSLTRLKLVVDGRLPPMTPVPGGALSIIDPAFTIGAGAFEEDPEKGLRCPVRGCGKYYHCLGRHITTMHSDIGGRIAVMDALEIPRTRRLISHAEQERYRVRWHQLDADEKARRIGRLNKAQQHMLELQRLGYRKHMPKRGMHLAGKRNLINRCEAQMREVMQRVEKKVGRSPTMADGIEHAGDAFVWHAISLYGNWNAAKKQFGLATYAPGVSPRRKAVASREGVLAALSAFYEIHGHFPQSNHAKLPNRQPVIPDIATIKKVFNTDSWGAAMREAARVLGLSGGRYGYPRNPSIRGHRAA